ncbi:M48 family metalloprotease [Hymenobacter tibetensis]|uniref:M48 family metalloprotease n=1 Tax=Hymenobacter tibetensis TaxID=497967 RepID=A0ABY4CV17_9BACT|nr:M56 family metallopeptidase [Hymenobacter tibetensis]UOG73951.1 M48 family metalloprotease [Hymenobacter tibetensis]
MNLLEHYGSPALMRALGWTLLHSVWQGALVALTAAMLLMLLHRHAAALRYRVAAASLLGLLVLSGITFGYYYHTFSTSTTNELVLLTEAPATTSLAASADVVVQDNGQLVTTDGIVAAETEMATQPSSRLQQLLTAGKVYLERNMPFVVVAWLLGMLAMTLRFLGSLAYVQRLRRYRVAALPAEWQTRLDALASRTNLRRPVQILASGLVPGPLVIGWLKPVVLLPMSAASGLSGSELEAILAHELAHVMRRDYLFNLLQSVAEILFFYHPAVWFLSGCLRTERENCCDDIATELCGDSLVLAQALASLAALQHAPATLSPKLAMAAAGAPGSLLNRVRRLVQHRAAAPTFSDGFWAACVVLFSVGLLTVSTVLSLSAASFTTPTAATETAGSVDVAEEVAAELAPAMEAQGATEDAAVGLEASEAKPLDDTVVVYAQTNPKLLTKSGKARLNEIKGLTVVVKDESGAVSDVYVDGKKVPAAELEAYRASLEKAEQAGGKAKTTVAGSQEHVDRIQTLSNRMATDALAGRSPNASDAEELSKLALQEAGQAMELHDASQSMLKQFQIEEKVLEDQLVKESLSADEQQELRENLKELRQEHMQELQELRTQEKQDREQAQRDRDQAHRDREQVLRDQDQARRDREQVRRNEEQARRNVEQTRRNKEQAQRDKEQAAWHKALYAELAKDNLVRDANNFSFALSQKSMSVNGNKQSEAMRDKYVKLYESSTGRKLSATGSVNIQQQSNSNSSFAFNDEMPPPPPAPRAPSAPRTPAFPRTPAVPRVPAVPRTPLVPRVPAVPRAPAAPHVNTDRIREELKQDGLLDKNAKGFSLQVNAKGLTVNGTQQSEELAAKYRKLLGHSADTNNSKSSSTIDISVSE